MEAAAITIVWVLYIAYNFSLFGFKGFQLAVLNYVQLSVSASVLAIVALTFLVYGLRVLSRLQVYEQEMKLRMSTMVCERMAPNQSFSLMLSDDDDGVPVVTEPKYARRQPNEGHSSKIKKILVAAEAISIVVIAGQIYMAITNATNSPVELLRANGSLCDTISAKWSVLHSLQVVCVWTILWVFRGGSVQNIISETMSWR